MDELRKAAGTAVDVWDDTGTRHEDVVNAMNDLRKVLAKNANAAPDAWTSVKAAMPQSGVTVLAYYKNSNGFERRIRAKWTAAKTVEANAEYDWGEYDEATDAYWTPEGWYECIDNWDEYSSVMVSEGEVTHWMPLPPAPQDQAKDAEAEWRDPASCINCGTHNKNAARYRWLRDHASDDWLDSGITDDAVDAAINDKSQWRKKP